MSVHPLHTGFWGNRDWTEFCRVAEALKAAGIDIEFAAGLTDEGDPWAAFTQAETGDPLLHFTRLEQRFCVESPLTGSDQEGASLHVLVAQQLAALRDTQNTVQGHSDEGDEWGCLSFTAFPDFPLHTALLDGTEVLCDANGQPLDAAAVLFAPNRGKPGTAGDSGNARGDDGLFGHSAIAVPGFVLLDPIETVTPIDGSGSDSERDPALLPPVDDPAPANPTATDGLEALIDPLPPELAEMGADVTTNGDLALICGPAVCGFAETDSAGTTTSHPTSESIPPSRLSGAGAAVDSVGGGLSGDALATDSAEMRPTESGRIMEDRSLGFRAGSGMTANSDDASGPTADAMSGTDVAATSRIRQIDVSPDSPNGTTVAAGSGSRDILDAGQSGGQVLAGDGNDIILGQEASPFHDFDVIPTGRQDDSFTSHTLNIDGGGGNDTVVLASPAELWAFIKLVLAQNGGLGEVGAQLADAVNIIDPNALGQDVVHLIGVPATNGHTPDASL